VPGGAFADTLLKAGIMMGMYLFGLGGGFGFAWLFKRTIFKGEPALMIMELPPYRLPRLGEIIRHMLERGWMFLRRAGTTILGISIVLWFLAAYPKINDTDAANGAEATSAGGGEVTSNKWQVASGENPKSQVPNPNEIPNHQNSNEAAASPASPAFPPSAPAASTFPPPATSADAGHSAIRNPHSAFPTAPAAAEQQLAQSFAGKAGRAIEPVIKPLGFDWRVGIGIIGSLAAREVFISTMGTVFSIENADEEPESLRDAFAKATWPDGRPLFTPLVCVTLLIFYVFAMQCLATLAVVRRETNSLRWPAFQLAYMTGAAWLLCLVIHQGGRLLGF
jgi:ferrous iron transport protein B